MSSEVLTAENVNIKVSIFSSEEGSSKTFIPNYGTIWQDSSNTIILNSQFPECRLLLERHCFKGVIERA
jgi:hypothetical protein